MTVADEAVASETGVPGKPASPSPSPAPAFGCEGALEFRVS